MITDFQKEIYNKWLRSYRINNNSPFKPKRKFDDITDPKKLLSLIKLEKFFAKHRHLFRNEFFDAPYKVYGDERKYYSLEYYASSKGLMSCVAYFKIINKSNPDEQMDFIKESIRFIYDFCLEKNIPLNDYSSYKSISQFDFLKHLKDHKISWYIVFCIDNLYQKLYTMDREEFELYFGSDLSLSQMYSKYMSSEQAKPFLDKKIKKIADLIIKNLKK